MPPELTAALIGIAVAASAGITQLIRAIVKNQMKRMEDAAEAARKKRDEDAEEARKDREAKRERELEAMRIETAKVQEDAAQFKVIGENLININATMIQVVNTFTKERFADREVQTNQIETIGELSNSIDRIAGAVVDSTSATKATAAKVETVVAAIEHLEQILNLGIKEIKLLLIPPPPPNVTEINTAPEVKTDVA